jgi:hypothetical protein
MADDHFVALDWLARCERIDWSRAVVDGSATKARYVGATAAALLAIFQKGGEAKLHAGDTIDVETRERSAGSQ